MGYDNIFIRNNVGDAPNQPKGASWTNSPDIICTGLVPLKDPSVLTDPTQYAQGLPAPSAQNPGYSNYVYVRGLNASSAAQTATLYLYYVDASVILWPTGWKNLISRAGQPGNSAQVTAGGNALVAVNPPFEWVPQVVGHHYCLVAWACNGPDQSTPPDLTQYSISTMEDMGNFIIAHPNIGWRNTIEVDINASTIQTVSTIVGPAAGGTMTIGVQCKNLPTDGTIEFSVPGPDGDNTIYFKGAILSKNYGPTMQVEWPANYKSAITINYYPGSTPRPQGSSFIALVASWMTPSIIKDLEYAAPHLLTEVNHYGRAADFNRRYGRGEAVEDMRAFVGNLQIIGSIPYKLTQPSQ